MDPTSVSSTCIAWRATELLCPVLMTGIPGNKDHHLLSADRGKQMQMGDYLTPLLCDSFAASLGGLEKRAKRGSNILIIYI